MTKLFFFRVRASDYVETLYIVPLLFTIHYSLLTKKTYLCQTKIIQNKYQ